MITLNDIRHFSITSPKGRSRYYEHLEYHREFGISIPAERKLPSVKEAVEYKELLKENRQSERWNQINGWRRLNKFSSQFDWRDIVTTNPIGLQGLRSPDGEKLLPEIFETVLSQTMSINYGKAPIPVSNGEGFGLVSPSENPLMLTPFIYKDIILERWNHNLYFVQSKETGKWGVLKFDYERTCKADSIKRRNTKWIKVLEELLPSDYDEIYEDEICTDCSPTLFWVFRKGRKLGILTPFHHSEALYDGYDTDWENCSFILYKDGVKKEMGYHKKM